MKHEHGRKGVRAALAPEKERNHERVVQETRPAHDVRHGGPREDGSDERGLRPRREPNAERLRVNEPIGLELRDARVEIDDRNLEAHQVEHPRRDDGFEAPPLQPGIDGVRAMKRQEAHQERE